MITCRRLAKDDIEEVRDLICRTIDISYRDAYPPEAIAFFKEYHSLDSIRRDAVDGTTLVGLQDDTIVGTGSLLMGEVKRVFVDPPHQGQGIGRAIMEALIAEARRTGLGMLSLDSSLVSRGMYEHLGFRFVRDGRHDLGNGLTLDYFLMTLEI